MIIICPWCEKKFSLNENLIPDKGRLLKCGFCDKTWFFNKKDNVEESQTTKRKTINKDESYDNSHSEIKAKNLSKKLDFNRNYELTKYKKKKSSVRSINLLSYLLVFIISFVALIVVLDTFKNPLYSIFPNLELILFSLFETLKDIELFIRDIF